MSEARSFKQREYGTDLISHAETNSASYAPSRQTNTFKSNAFHNEPDRQATAKNQQRRDQHFNEKPLTKQVTRASYQDSNLFGTKDVSRGTVQGTALAADKDVRQRNNGTYQSNVFGGAASGAAPQRQQNTFNSSVFGTPQPEKCGRTRLGGASSGTAALFGSAAADFDTSSKNGLIAKPAARAEPQPTNPAVATMTANEAKARELHGESATRYGYNANKRDGALMASGADWKNVGQSATNQASPQKKINQATDAGNKDRKYSQLQSSVFGGGYADGEKPAYETDVAKIAFGTTADWKHEAGRAKPVNAGPARVDTFQQRQKQLSSGVFEQTDYSSYAPITKKPVDVNNAQQSVASPTKTGRKTNDEFKQGVRGFEPTNKNYNPQGQKQGMLASAFDKPVDAPAPVAQQNYQSSSYSVPGRATKTTKQAFLASSDPFTGANSLATYDNDSKPEVVDLSLRNLPTNFESADLKRLSGARHIISAVVDEDNMKGICLGTGRIQIRLNQGESLDAVKLNYLKQGFAVKETTQETGKKPQLTQAPREADRDITDSRSHKQSHLSTQNPDMYGNTGYYQARV